MSAPSISGFRHGSRSGTGRRGIAPWLVAALLLAVPVAPAFAQGPPMLSVATLDQEALFLESAFGRRVTMELERDRDALTAENRIIEADLIAEERVLIVRRAELPPADFAPLAEAFDSKVQRFRDEQDRKGRLLQLQFEEARQRFLGEIGPVLTDLLRARGAQVLLDRAAVLISVEGVDITAAAIASIDARLGDGTGGNPDLRDAPTMPGPDVPDAPGSDADPDADAAPPR